MRLRIAAAVATAILCSGCASTQVVAPKGVDTKREAADRSHCRNVGEATKNDPKTKEQVEQHVSASMVGSVIGGGLIGLAVAGSQQDQRRANYATAFAAQATRECLVKKGYKPEGS
ncbi:MAG: hypothetical protein ABL982_24310 [Vicinamibacterales bacterium]